MIYACIVVGIGITSLLILKKRFKRTRSVATQTPLKALTNRAVQTVEYCLYGSDTDSEEAGMDIVSTYFGYASDSVSFLSELEYSDNEHETSSPEGKGKSPAVLVKLSSV